MNKRIIRWISVFMAAVLCLTAFAACRAKTNDMEKETDKMSFEEIYAEAARKYADNKNPVAVIVMQDGSVIAFEMYPELAVNTVRNFVSLANKGFYDGIIFHRVIEKFMIQTGDPTGTGMGGPGYRIVGEFANNGYNNTLSHTDGVVSMAREGNRYNPAAAYDTAGSQFFICAASPTYLDGDYAAFGKVIDGMDVVYRIASVNTDANDKPLTDQVMAYVRVDTHGVAFNEPETIAE